MSKKLMSGLIWSLIEVLIKRVLDLGVRLVLARLLFPEDFGIVGMATVFYSFILVINEAGLGMALIQRKEEDLTEAHFHTVFWSNLVLSLVLFILFAFLLGPFSAYFYNEPMLKEILPVLGLSLLFSSLNTVHKAQLMKHLMLKKMAFINNTSTVISGIIAISLGFLGFGVWALISYNVLASIISVPLFFRATRWTPKFIWSNQAFKDVFGFGIYTTGTKLITNIASNIDYLIIGKILTAAALGAYALAFMLTNLVKSQIESMLNRVLFPFYSSIQNDFDQIKLYYLKSLKYYAACIYPLMSFLILSGDTIIFIFFGDKWSEAVLPAKILAWAAIVNVIGSGYNLLFRSVGKPKEEMKIQLVTVVLFLVPAILIGAYLYGIVGAAYGILISKTARVLSIQYLLHKEFKITPKNIVLALKEPVSVFALTFCIGSAFIYLSPFNEYMSLFVVLLLNVSFTFLFMKKDIKGMKSLIRPKTKIVDLNSMEEI